MSQPLKVAGVDVGSSAIKVVILEDAVDREPSILIARRERVRRRDPVSVAHSLFDACLLDLGLERDELDYIATTGEGEMIEFRTGHFYGMTTHARGGQFHLGVVL